MGLMVATKRFVYGAFQYPFKKKARVLPPVPGSEPDRVAVEVLQEYSASELLGKVYVYTLGSWRPLDPTSIDQYDWYRAYKKLPARFRPADFKFEMDGSGPWKVLHFRNESDERGPYVAVALQFAGS